MILGSLFESSLSPQEPESEAVWPVHLLDTTFPRRITSPASFRICHRGNRGCSLVQTQTAPVWQWVGADSSERGGRAVVSTGEDQACLSGGSWVGVYVGVQHSVSRTHLGKDPCDLKTPFFSALLNSNQVLTNGSSSMPSY